MSTEAQKRAKNKYRRQSVKAMTLEFYPTESDLVAFINLQENKQGYIKDLIRQDIKKARG